MTATIKATCPECREEIILPQKHVRVDIYPNAEACTYTFTCPECGTLAIKPATGAVRQLLETASSVAWVRHFAPAEVDELKLGPVLTEDDIANFMIDLNLTPAHLISVLAGGDR